MRGERIEASAHGSPVTGPASPQLRTVGLAAGSVLAVAATVVVFLTEDPQVLRLAVVAAAWAFVLALLVGSRPGARGTDVDGGTLAEHERAAAEREADLRVAYELELEREVAARREHELRVENDLRRTAEQSMRAELDGLRAELAQLTELRRELGQVAELRREVAEVAALRRDLAGLAELRSTLAGIDLTPLAELRADVGRLRTELAEQLSSEMLVERVLLRTQSTRTTPAVDAGAWDGPEPTAARPAVRTDDPATGTRRPGDRVEPEPAPLDRLAHRSLPGEPPAPAAEPGYRRRRSDPAAPVAPPAPDEVLTTERPVARRERPPVPPRPAPPVAPAPAPPPAASPAPAEDQPATRLAELIAESGLTPPSGGRRRRRYREDDETDDVLSRVLGR